MNEGLSQRPLQRLQGGSATQLDDWVADEQPLVLVYNGTAHAVLMCTPLELEELAVGFTLSEAIVPAYHLILDFELVALEQGFEARLSIPQQYAAALRARRRNLASGSSCGVCGSAELEQLLRPLPTQLSQFAVPARRILDGMAQLAAAQPLNQLCGGLHAAGWLDETGLVVCEDIGRHNALDKLIGRRALRRAAGDGVLLLSSRLSYEMVQKAAQAQMPLVAAISAPTRMAIDLADAAGLCLAGFVRGGRMNVYSAGWRVQAD